MSADSRSVLIAHPSPDRYGADLQMLHSVDALRAAKYRVTVAVPGEGPLVAELTRRGADVVDVYAPLLQRSRASLSGVATLARDTVTAQRHLCAMLRATGADVLYVNTLTLPVWLLAARLARVPSLCHVHEAEAADSRAVRTALTAPLLLANRVIANSRTTRDTALRVVPQLTRRIQVIRNGVAGPPHEPTDPRPHAGPRRLAVIGRLSPRKGCMVALEATSRLLAQGHDVTLDLHGTPFAGYEWFEQELRGRAAQPDLIGRVNLRGYAEPVWNALDEADIVLAPSARESLGNAAIEAQLAARPLVAAGAMGQLESVSDERSGLLARPEDPDDMARQCARIIADPALAATLAHNGRQDALRRFSVQRYGREIVEVVGGLARQGKA